MYTTYIYTYTDKYIMYATYMTQINKGTYLIHNCICPHIDANVHRYVYICMYVHMEIWK